MVKYYNEEDYLDVDSHVPYLKDELIDKEVAEKLSKELSSNIIEQVKHNINNMDNSIEERAKEYAPDAIDSNYLISLLREDSPCKAAKKVVLNVGKLKIHTLDMPTEADIEDMWKNIYKHCIEL